MRKVKIFYIVAILIVMFLFFYIGVSYYRQTQLTLQLNQVLDDTLKEKEQLQALVKQSRATIEQSRMSLGQLQNDNAFSRKELSKKENQIAALKSRLVRQAAIAFKASALKTVVTVDDKKLEEVKSEMNQLAVILIKKELEIDAARKDAFSAKDELDKLKKGQEETNAMYDSLKAQIAQFSGMISQKDAQMENKRVEISNLRAELSILKNRSQQLESDLLKSKENQKKVMGDLLTAVKLNAALQERVKFSSSDQAIEHSFSAEDKKKADELKRKIEVILQSDKDKE